MKINVFMHTIEDAKYFYKYIYKKDKEYDLYVTHAGVCEYIEEVYNKNAKLLSTLIKQDKINKINSYTEKLSIKIIKLLDKKYSKVISKNIGIKNMNYFNALYSYHLPFILSGLLVFKELLFDLNKNKNKNIIFDYIDIFFGSFSLRSFIDYFLIQDDIEITWHKSEKKRKKESILDLITRAIKQPKKVARVLNDYLNEFFAYNRKDKKTILYMENLYDLNFIKQIKDFKFISYRNQSLYHKFSKKSKNFRGNIINFKKNDIKDNIDFLSEQLIKNFEQNIEKYSLGLKILDDLLNNENIDIALWGNPPVEGFKSLFYEYCKTKNIPVIGMQHGASYVDQNISYHYHSDFKRCKHYISYGFTNKDLENNFKNKVFKNLNINSFGSTKEIKKTKNNSTINILFPVTNTISLFDGGLARAKPDDIHNDQKDILYLLEKNRNNITFIVKPFPNTNIWQTSVFYRLKKLKSQEVEWSRTLTELLTKVNFNCVIIEYLSTPLYEVIYHDVEVFLFVRESDNLTEKAKIMLEKRVYIIKNIDEFNIIFKKFIASKLPKKRDNSYFNYYVHKNNTKLNIINLLKKI